MPDQKSRLGQGQRVRETVKQREARQRQERLKKMQEDVKSGDLVIRKMTPKEREKYPPHQPLKVKAKNQSRYRA